jgi:PAS domain S-box-containing protein
MVKSMERTEGEDRVLGEMLEVIRFTEGVSAKLHRVLDEAKIYQVVKDEFTKSDRYTASILLLVDEGASLKIAEVSLVPSRLKVLEKASGLQAKEFMIKLSKSSICRQVVREGKTVHTNVSDMIGEFLPRPVAYLISKMMGYDKQFSILTPLYKYGKVAGVLAMSCGDLCEYFIHPVENLALHISTALELADEHDQRQRAVQALEKYHGHLGELVEERTTELKAVNEKLREEITERKQVEEALRESREKLQKMFESVTDGISVVNLKGVIIETNQRTVEMHGYKSRDELLGRSASELVAPRDRERIAANMRRAVKEGVVRGAEYTLLKADGSEFPGELSTSILKDAAGNWVGHITVSRDITKRKRAEEAIRESEERFRSIVENSHAGIIILDDAYRFVYVNDELAQISGYSRDELAGQDFRDFLDKESKELVAERYVQRQQGKEVPPRYEFNIVRKDGQKRHVEVSSAVIKDSAGEIRTVAQVLDITERKGAEEALQAEKNKLQSLVDAMEDGITIQDKDYNIIYQNEALRVNYGERLGEKCYRVYEGRDKVCEGCPVEKAFKDGKSHTSGRSAVLPSGGVAFGEVTANPIRDAEGKIVSCLEVVRNVTERKQSEEALRESQKFSSSLLASSPNPICVVELDTSIRYVNPAFERFTGFTLAEITGRKAPYPWWPEGRRERILASFKDAVEHGGRRTERNFQKKNGERFWVALNSAPVMEGGKPVYLIINWLDITERKQAEEALQTEKNKLQSLVDAMEDGITIQDKDYNIIYEGKLVETIFGDRRGEKCYRVYEGREELCDGCPVEKAFKDGESHTSERRVVMPSGEVNFWENTANPIRDAEGKIVSCLEIVRNITERKRAEEKEKQLQQELYLAQRLASVGELAAGVAHEINNPLTGVLGFSQRLMRKSTDEKVSHDLEVIHSEAQRAAEVVQSLLTFARRRQPKKEYANINDIVNKTLELRAYALQTGNIEVVTTLAHRLPQIMVDFSQMQEVFLNIILNAEQAMSEARGKGKLTIKTRRLKDYVRVSFADNGPGILPENLDKVFDPFFTTREETGGTGLGLSACHGIVTEHGGRIYATSKPRKGATFFVELPLSLAEATNGRKV